MEKVNFVWKMSTTAENSLKERLKKTSWLQNNNKEMKNRKEKK